jgi:hypothetical protein
VAVLCKPGENDNGHTVLQPAIAQAGRFV